jgi:hypothetical protein
VALLVDVAGDVVSEDVVGFFLDCDGFFFFALILIKTKHRSQHRLDTFLLFFGLLYIEVIQAVVAFDDFGFCYEKGRFAYLI